MIKDSDLSILVTPYAWIGVFILFVFLVMLSCKMPRGEKSWRGKPVNIFPREMLYEDCIVIKNIGRGSWHNFFTWVCNHVLDVYYSIRYRYIHAGGVNGKERGNTVPEIQYCRHGVVLREQVCMHFLVKVYSPE